MEAISAHITMDHNAYKYSNDRHLVEIRIRRTIEVVNSFGAGQRSPMTTFAFIMLVILL